MHRKSAPLRWRVASCGAPDPKQAVAVSEGPGHESALTAICASDRQSCTCEPIASGRSMYKHLVVVGGGFAGMTAAKCLEHTLPPDWTLTVISQENFITFHPLLPEVVGASVLPGHVIAPHRQMIHCSHVCMAQVTEIDTQSKVIHYLGEGPG